MIRDVHLFIPDPDLDFLLIRAKRGQKGTWSRIRNTELLFFFRFFLYRYVLFSDVQDLREMFEPFGTVMEADVISGKNYGFVHIDASIGKAKISQIVRLVPIS